MNDQGSLLIRAAGLYRKGFRSAGHWYDVSVEEDRKTFRDDKMSSV
jgi:hypothetical protein